MAPDDDLRERIADQFSYRGERADIWRAFDRLLETDAYLNLGYSRRYQTHLLGGPQRRLASEVGRTLAAHREGPTEGTRLLDVGCGRGGPALHLAERFGFRVTGVDLVPYNVRRARANARAGEGDGGDGGGAGPDVEFLVGDATRLPVAPDSVDAATAVDALVYLSDRDAVFAELADALRGGGLFVCSDLFLGADAGDDARDRVARFADAWDMPVPGTVEDYEAALEEAGFDVVAVRDLTPNSVGGFRKWTTLYRWLARGPAGRLLDGLLRRWGVDPAVVDEQVRLAHDALPGLRHGLVVARR